MRFFVRILVLMLVGLGLFWGFHLYDGSPTESDHPERATNPSQDAPPLSTGTILREDAQEREGASSAAWAPTPERLAALKTAFMDYHYEGGGEERIIEYQSGKLRGRPGEILRERLEPFPDRFHQAGLSFDATLINMDGMLRVAGNHLANTLNHQLDRYSQWQQEGLGDPNRLPRDTMSAYPLDFPPEMWFAELTGAAPGSASSQLLTDMALLRNRILRQDAMLFQEKYILNSSMIEVSRNLGEEIPSEQWDSVWAGILPRYDHLLAEQESLKQEYFSGVQALVSQD